MGYTKEAIKGVSWLGAFRLFARVLSFLRTIIVARILSPAQFGVYGIAALALSLIEILTETGINVFLVQNKGLAHEMGKRGKEVVRQKFLMPRLLRDELRVIEKLVL